MKRLLIDVNSIVPYYLSGKVSGIGRTTLELIQAMAEIADELPFEIMLYSQNMKGLGGKNTGLPFPSRHLYLRHTEFWDTIVAKLSLRERLTGYDIMHIPANHEIIRHPEKCIFTLHDAMFMRFQEQQFDHSRMKMIVPPLMQRCKHIITCSESSKKDIIETMNIDPEKITVTYWGIKHEVFYQQNEKEAVKHLLQDKYKIHLPYFFSVSCGTERKRSDVLVKSYIEFCHHVSTDYDLVLVWNNPPKEVIEAIKQNGLSEKVHFLSNVPDEDLALLYNGATSMFFPSMYEGFGLPVLEAMACGTPVVTCDNSSLGEVAGDCAIYLDKPVEKSMVETMKGLHTGIYNIDKLRADGMERATKFTWKECAEKTAMVYRHCLEI
jgi:glycosyltransferase involved in cell wall biosynthesis